MSDSNPYETPLASTAQSSFSQLRTYSLKRIDPMSCGVLAAVLYAILGLIGGVFLALFFVVGALAQNGPAAVGIAMSVGVVVMMPVLYGGGGFILGIVGAVIYNACAGLVGGIKFDME